MATTTKIVLGKRPDTFKPFPVKFTMPDGSNGEITATYRYRTRAEFGQLLDQMNEAAAAQDQELPLPVAEPLNWERLYAKADAASADQLMASLVAWDLDVPLTLDNVKALINEIPAGASALMTSYSEACREGRLGN